MEKANNPNSPNGSNTISRNLNIAVTIVENLDSQEPDDWAYLAEFIAVYKLALDSGSFLIYWVVINEDNIINIEEDEDIISWVGKKTWLIREWVQA